jgi:hypothetical protein
MTCRLSSVTFGPAWLAAPASTRSGALSAARRSARSSPTACRRRSHRWAASSQDRSSARSGTQPKTPARRYRDEGVVAPASAADGGVADETPARPKAARDLGQSRLWAVEAVEAVEAETEVEARVFEGERLDVGLDELDLAEAAPLGDPARAAEHPAREVGGDVADPLAPAKGAEREPAAAGGVEDGRAVRHSATTDMEP